MGFSPFGQVWTVSLMRVCPLLQSCITTQDRTGPFHRADGAHAQVLGVKEIPTEASALKACTHSVTVFSLHTKGLDLASWSTEVRRTEG